MTEVSAAARAQHLRALDNQAVIGSSDDGMGEHPPEARPAGPALELGGRAVQRVGARRADEDSAAVLVEKWARERRFGRGLAKHGLALRTEDAAPFRRRMIDRKSHGGGGPPGTAEQDHAPRSCCSGEADKRTAVEIHSRAPKMHPYRRGTAPLAAPAERRRNEAPLLDPKQQPILGELDDPVSGERPDAERLDPEDPVALAAGAAEEVQRRDGGRPGHHP